MQLGLWLALLPNKVGDGYNQPGHCSGGEGWEGGRCSKRLGVSIFVLVHFNILPLVCFFCASGIYAVFNNVRFQK